jgi:hypothetical protein
MIFNRQMFSEGIGLYELTRDGRRAVLSQREAEIRRLEEHAFAKAEANKRAQYLVRDWDGRLFIADDPGGLTIVRVCPYLESPKTTK